MKIMIPIDKMKEQYWKQKHLHNINIITRRRKNIFTPKENNAWNEDYITISQEQRLEKR